jgi:hypothetical protein
MSIHLVVTHPHYDICGEITHWEYTTIETLADPDALSLYTPDAETIWQAVRTHGSYQRAFGLPFFPIWLGRYGGMRSLPETSPTADWVWCAENATEERPAS